MAGSCSISAAPGIAGMPMRHAVNGWPRMARVAGGPALARDVRRRPRWRARAARAAAGAPRREALRLRRASASRPISTCSFGPTARTPTASAPSASSFLLRVAVVGRRRTRVADPASRAALGAATCCSTGWAAIRRRRSASWRCGRSRRSTTSRASRLRRDLAALLAARAVLWCEPERRCKRARAFSGRSQSRLFPARRRRDPRRRQS